MPIRDPYAFLEAKVKELANETSNIKNILLFDIDFKPNRILIRKELGKVTNDLADYVNLNLPGHIIIYGSKGSGKTLSALIMAKTLNEIKSVQYYYLNIRENPISIKIYYYLTKIASWAMTWMK